MGNVESLLSDSIMWLIRLFAFMPDPDARPRDCEGGRMQRRPGRGIPAGS